MVAPTNDGQAGRQFYVKRAGSGQATARASDMTAIRSKAASCLPPSRPMRALPLVRAITKDLAELRAK